MTKSKKNTNIVSQSSMKKEGIITSYDDFPYTSYPFPYTRPEYIGTVGTLFGINPPPLETARILDMGCAGGNNIINFAEIYPNSYTLGIDLSKVQIEQGLELINKLQLKNIELKHLSITDLDESFGKFDYIICHGVLSWVPEPVRNKIVEVSKKLLNPQGISLISYNTLPGWNMINTIRDMMLFHSSSFSDTSSKIQQSKLFLNFINESLEGSSSSYGNFLKEEARVINQREDSYLRHEYLSEDNKQFYFHEFIKMAKGEGLAYLGEANVHSMFLGNMPSKAVEKLQHVKDIILTEQYMDFVQNRRFRCTLLCHEGLPINRNITPENINRFYITCNIVTAKPEKEIDLKNSLETISFYLESLEGTNVSTSSSLMKAIFYTFAENKGNPLKSEELFKLASAKVSGYKLTDFEKEFNNISAKLVFTGFLKLFVDKPKTVSLVSTTPVVSNLVKNQVSNIASNKLWVTNQINEVVYLNPYEIVVLQNLDGKNDLDRLVEIMLSKFLAGEINANEGEKRITDKASLEVLARQCVNLALERCRTSYLLIG
ncbi:MAG: methyltransferase regulatory domain-containing protein [Janthinobacterium lividum]